MKSMVEERAIRTVKSRLEGVIMFIGKLNQIDHFSDVINSINNTIHTSIKMKPVDNTQKDEGQAHTYILEGDININKNVK
jgi:hypothetical protein